MSNPRAEFVEAMRRIVGLYAEQRARVGGTAIDPVLRRVCIAFADAYYVRGDPENDRVHPERRTALLRDCGLEELSP